jgi:uncharacterized protein (DUF1778 family)
MNMSKSKILENLALIQLNPEGQRRFAELMEQPPKPTEAMKTLGELSDFEEIR